jgi:DNA-binding NarL/FixJ family response regulator
MRILVVSDIRVVQEGLYSVLAQQDGVDLVSTANMRQAKHQSAQLTPDIVLFDAARMESMGIIRDLVASSPHSKVVAFGVKETGAEIQALTTAGTACCVRDNAAGCDIVRALEQVLCGGARSGPPSVASGRRALTGIAEGNGGDGHPYTMPLSPRELQIARLIQCGFSNKGIARQLGIEAATVKNHIHNICEKLKVHRRGEVAACIRSEEPRSMWMG